MCIKRLFFFIDIVFSFQFIVGLHDSKNGIPSINATSASKISNLRSAYNSPNLTVHIVYAQVVTRLPSASFTDIF